MGRALCGQPGYFMKIPPEQYTNHIARARVENFVVGSDHYGQPETGPMLTPRAGI